MSWDISGNSLFSPKPGYTTRYCYCQNDLGSVQIGFLYAGDIPNSDKLEMILLGVQKQGDKKICLCLEYDGQTLGGQDNNLGELGIPLDTKTWDGFFKTAREVINLGKMQKKELYLLLKATLDMVERAPYLHIEESSLEQAL